MPLAIVEEPSQGSGDGDSEPGHADIAVANGAVAKTLKRSPYLSEMTKTADSDLMALLSRPAGRGGGGRVTGGAAKTGGGGVDFLQLNRPELDGECASKVGVFTSR
ncbi:hypothetical protein HJC23_004563 [Cyclotella cryptica]|uniref:Uncharacterized protein n=1 Tax=Cyclotella cryptica TaxID=29204 RepID=A0ABD3QCR0_9STRA|eukprot:CCRYP_007311-RA/>CCRYP_007311-RA protein AED:0.45 eAED:0.45 QI:0/-1/0/1/-1/1/1/0/105